MILSQLMTFLLIVRVHGDVEPQKMLSDLLYKALQHLASSSSSSSSSSDRADRTVDTDQLTSQLSQTMVIFSPKLEITSPNFPPDGGSLQVYSTIPVSLDALKNTVLQSSARESDYGGDYWSGASWHSKDSLPLSHRQQDHDYSIKSRADDHMLVQSGGVHDYLEMFLERLGMPGAACLSRIVCHLSADPLRNNGLLGDVINILAEEPSSTSRGRQEELKVARSLGLSGASCKEAFNNCQNMLIDRIIPNFIS